MRNVTAGGVVSSATAIVITHNAVSGHAGAAHLREGLAALLAAGLVVRVVDNASDDGTVALVATHFPAVKLLVNDRHLGFAGAVNEALREPCADVVLLVDPACVVPPDTAHELVRFVRERPQVGIAGPRLVGPGGRISISAHPFESLASVVASRFGGGWVPVALRRMLCGADRRRAYDACRHADGPSCVDWLSGACLAVRTELLANVGGLDDAYFHDHADQELCLSAWRQATSVVYLPAVSAWQRGPARAADPVHQHRGLLRFVRRHRPGVFAAVRATVLVRAALGFSLALLRVGWQPAAGALRARTWVEVARLALIATSDSLEHRAGPGRRDAVGRRALCPRSADSISSVRMTHRSTNGLPETSIPDLL
jgi:N-acetylglucosaminyl-diphospho-decaprenol L-rhamnosyltransferase